MYAEFQFDFQFQFQFDLMKISETTTIQTLALSFSPHLRDAHRATNAYSDQLHQKYCVFSQNFQYGLKQYSSPPEVGTCWRLGGTYPLTPLATSGSRK